MSLINKLKMIKPRENSGSISSNRFDYQKNWAICKLIELSNENDFLLAFEFYEDIIVFNSSSKPDKIDFYQVKTKKSGKHSISSLLKKTNGNSILGKLFINKINFINETDSLSIIANCDYKLTLNNGKNIEFKTCSSELNSSEKNKLATGLTNELSIKWNDKYFDCIYFEKSDLTIEHHSDLTQQKLNKHIERLNENIKYNPTLAYTTIFDEVKRRNNYEKKLDTFEELIKYKSFTKNDFDKILKIVSSEPNRFELLKKEILNRLDSENVSLSFRRFFKQNWGDIEVEYLKPNNRLFKKIVTVVNETINTKELLLDDSIINSMENILKEVYKNKFISTQFVFDENNIKMIILKDICDGE